MTSISTAQALLEALRAGRTSWTKAADGEWMIIGPAADIKVGATVTVTTRTGGTSQVTVARLGACGERDGIAYQVATIATQAAERDDYDDDRPRAPRCVHGDTDNHGICYACGAYIPADDAGRVIRRYRLLG